MYTRSQIKNDEQKTTYVKEQEKTPTNKAGVINHPIVNN